MNILLYALIVSLAYLLGCSNMALYVSKLKGVDMRASGSKNLGASNAMVLMGWRFGVLVGIHDIGKAVLAVALARYLGGSCHTLQPPQAWPVSWGTYFPSISALRAAKDLPPTWA